MKLTGERTIKDSEIVEAIEAMKAGTSSKGSAIRTLFAGGLSVKEIAAETGIRYNHVYNVVKNEVLTKGLSDMVEKSGRDNEHSKKNQILGMLAEGKSINDISRELQCLYNYVWQIAKAGGYTQKQVKETVEVGA